VSSLGVQDVRNTLGIKYNIQSGNSLILVLYSYIIDCFFTIKYVIKLNLNYFNELKFLLSFLRQKYISLYGTLNR